MIKKLLCRGLQIFAIFLFLKAGRETVSNISILLTATLIQGKVVSSYQEFDYSTQTGGKRYGTSNYIDRPIIQYIINGTTYRFYGQIWGEMGSDFQMGQSVPLYYLPDNPYYSVLASFYEMWYDPIRTFIFSVFVFFIGSFLLQWKRPQR